MTGHLLPHLGNDLVGRAAGEALLAGTAVDRNHLGPGFDHRAGKLGSVDVACIPASAMLDRYENIGPDGFIDDAHQVLSKLGLAHES